MVVTVQLSDFLNCLTGYLVLHSCAAGTLPHGWCLAPFNVSVALARSVEGVEIIIHLSTSHFKLEQNANCFPKLSHMLSFYIVLNCTSLDTAWVSRNLQLVNEAQDTLGKRFFCLRAIGAIVSAVESAILCVKEVDNKRML